MVIYLFLVFIIVVFAYMYCTERKFAEREVSGLVAITERQHDEYMKVIEEKMEAEMRLKREEVGDVQE